MYVYLRAFSIYESDILCKIVRRNCIEERKQYLYEYIVYYLNFFIIYNLEICSIFWVIYLYQNMDTYSVVHFFDDETVEALPSVWVKGKFCAWPKNSLFIKKFIEKKLPTNEKEFKYLKARVLSRGIKTLEEARKLADEARYKSDFSAPEEECIKTINNQYSPTLSTSSMPIFSDFENDDEPQFLKKGNTHHISKNKNGWSPSPQKLRSGKNQITTQVTKHTKSPLKSLSQEAFYSINKQHKFNKDENDQELSSTLKKKYSGHKDQKFKKKLFDNELTFKDGNKSPENQDLMCEKSQNEAVLLNRSKNKIRTGSPIYKSKNFDNEQVDNQLLDDNQMGCAVNSITQKDRTSPYKFNSIEFGVTINGLLQSQNHLLRNMTFLKYELKQVLTNQALILDKFDQIEKYMEKNAIMNKPLLEVDGIDFSDCPLPIDNMYALQTFEDKISGDHNYKNQLIIELSHIGGKNVKSVVKRLMSKLFTDCLLSNYSYTGKKGKNKFSNLFICSVIFDAVKKQVKFKSTPLNEIEDVIKYILAQSPFSMKRQLEKNVLSNSI